MTDARLVGTNPEDSSLVPVAVNSQGQLKVEKALIEEIPNDVTIDGTLTVNGQLLGPDGQPIGGSQLPPDPQEGQWLGWKDGQLAWCGGGDEGTTPPGSEDDQVIIRGDASQPDTMALAIASPNLEADWITDLNAHLRSLDTWDDPSLAKQQGVGRVTPKIPKYELEMKKVFGKVCNLYMSAKVYGHHSLAHNWIHSITFTENADKVQPIKVSETVAGAGDGSWMLATTVFSFLCTRDDFTVKFTHDFTGEYYAGHEGGGYYLHKWELVDPPEGLLMELFKQRRKDEVSADLIGSGEIAVDS